MRTSRLTRATEWILAVVSCAFLLPVSLPALDVTLAWTANTESDLGGYRLYYGPSSGNYPNSVPIGRVTTHTLRNLANGVAYYFALTATNTAGLESDFSDEAVYQPAVNTAPTISAIGDETINEDATATVAFTISDTQTAAGSLQVSAVSSNTVLVPNTATNLALSGTGTSRTLLVRPTANASGVTTIAITVSDGALSATETFALTVTAVNDAPTITALPSVVTGLKQTSLYVTGFLGDIDAAPGSVTVNWRARYGTILLLTDVANGLVAADVQGNGTTNVTVTALRPRINFTWRYIGGVTYTGMRNFVGSDTLTVTINDNGNTGAGGPLADTASATINVTGGVMDTWRIQQFGLNTVLDPSQEQSRWGENADPDGDGSVNVFEYALGLNPLSADSSAGVLYTGLSESGGNQYLTLTFNRRSGDPELQYLPELSADQATWSGGASQVSTTPLNADFERVTYRDGVAITADTPRFIRLRVVQDTP